MIHIRHTLRPVRPLLAAGRVVGEYLRDQRVDILQGNRWLGVKGERQMSAGGSRTPHPA